MGCATWSLAEAATDTLPLVDYWGDAAQICTAVGGAFAGVFTVGVAIYGRKLWQATGQLRDYTKELGERTADLRDETKALSGKTADLADATHQLVDQTAEANNLARRAAVAELHALLKPKLDVRIESGTSDYATLLIRHAVDSESECIDELSVIIATQFDRGEPDENKPIIGPWRFKQGTDGADQYGRNADSRGPLPRGVQTRWALSRQTVLDPRSTRARRPQRP